MWTFTQTGFYSTVAYDPDRAGIGVPQPADSATDELLLVRTRAKGDLTQMLEAVELPGSRATSSPNADYPWRAVVTRGEWSGFLSREATRLDYSNFKDRVEERSGPARHDIYLRVWMDLRGIREPDDLGTDDGR